MLREDRARGNDAGEGLDQLLDLDIFGTRAVPYVEQVIVYGRYEFTVGTREAGDIENLGDGTSGSVISISFNRLRIHGTGTHTNTLLAEQV